MVRNAADIGFAGPTREAQNDITEVRRDPGRPRSRPHSCLERPARRRCAAGLPARPLQGWVSIAAGHSDPRGGLPAAGTVLVMAVLVMAVLVRGLRIPRQGPSAALGPRSRADP